VQSELQLNEPFHFIRVHTATTAAIIVMSTVAVTAAVVYYVNLSYTLVCYCIDKGEVSFLLCSLSVK
jgi:hypothetical protein